MTVITKIVPAGNYAIFAKMFAQANEGIAVARCVMRANGVLVDDTRSFATDGVGGFVAIQGAASMSTAGPILVECNDSADHSLVIDAVRISVISVSTIQ